MNDEDDNLIAIVIIGVCLIIGGILSMLDSSLEDIP